jgi:thiol-disulfide isomerase/thioredoxin
MPKVFLSRFCGQPSSRSIAHAGRWLLACAVLAVGVAGGVYTGSALVAWFGTDPASSLTNYSLLDAGDRFPDYTMYALGDQHELSLSGIVGDRPALLLFLAQECGYCRLLLSFWEKRVLPQLHSDVIVILIFDRAELPLEEIEEYRLGYVGDLLIVAMDRTLHKTDDGIVSTPTIVALGPDMGIVFIQSGFDRGVTADFINERL